MRTVDSAAEQPEARRRMPRAQREALMLDVAEELFGELGYRAASMDEIARLFPRDFPPGGKESELGFATAIGTIRGDDGRI